MVSAAQGASIAQRLDRLPVTWTLWRLALVPGALLPGLLLARFGIDQRAAPLESVAGV
ncbi:MAG TPA: hypothetical protein VKI99_18890 [Candidatus Dormibacteraeota bacterium]|nr:hypothetical protein [Candidatus Dormibacteraeota bacterium]